jgi:DNA-binding response OmpR family regulator
LVLLVDDSEPIRFAFGELLGMAGFTVMTASDGRNGIDTLADLARAGTPPAAVIADLVMDDVPGYDVILEAKRRFPDCPVIAISGGTPNVDPELPLDLAKRRGADVCLRKPFGNDELLAVLKRHIGRT